MVTMSACLLLVSRCPHEACLPSAWGTVVTPAHPFPGILEVPLTTLLRFGSVFLGPHFPTAWCTPPAGHILRPGFPRTVCGGYRDVPENVFFFFPRKCLYFNVSRLLRVCFLLINIFPSSSFLLTNSILWPRGGQLTCLDPSQGQDTRATLCPLLGRFI